MVYFPALAPFAGLIGSLLGSLGCSDEEVAAITKKATQIRDQIVAVGKADIGQIAMDLSTKEKAGLLKLLENDQLAKVIGVSPDDVAKFKAIVEKVEDRFSGIRQAIGPKKALELLQAKTLPEVLQRLRTEKVEGLEQALEQLKDLGVRQDPHGKVVPLSAADLKAISDFLQDKPQGKPKETD